MHVQIPNTIYKIKYNILVMNSKAYKFTRRVLSMMRNVNLLNNGNASLLVPKSEVLSAEFELP